MSDAWPPRDLRVGPACSPILRAGAENLNRKFRQIAKTGGPPGQRKVARRRGQGTGAEREGQVWQSSGRSRRAVHQAEDVGSWSGVRRSFGAARALRWAVGPARV